MIKVAFSHTHTTHTTHNTHTQHTTHNTHTHTHTHTHTCGARPDGNYIKSKAFSFILFLRMGEGDNYTQQKCLIYKKL